MENKLTDDHVKRLKYISENNGQIFQMIKCDFSLVKDGLIYTDSGGYMRVSTKGIQTLTDIEK